MEWSSSSLWCWSMFPPAIKKTEGSGTTRSSPWSSEELARQRAYSVFPVTSIPWRSPNSKQRELATNQHCSGKPPLFCIQLLCCKNAPSLHADCRSTIQTSVFTLFHARYNLKVFCYYSTACWHGCSKTAVIYTWLCTDYHVKNSSLVGTPTKKHT